MSIEQDELETPSSFPFLLRHLACFRYWLRKDQVRTLLWLTVLEGEKKKRAIIVQARGIKLNKRQKKREGRRS